MSIVESDGPPSRSLDVSETGESTKCLWVGVMGLKAWGEGAENPIFLARRALHHPYPRAFCTLPSFARIKRPRWRPVGLNDRHLRSNGKIGDREQSIRIKTNQSTMAKLLRDPQHLALCWVLNFAKIHCSMLWVYLRKRSPSFVLK